MINTYLFSLKYTGTFAVSLGSGGDGESPTLTTHKERTRFVKKKLREYRVGYTKCPLEVSF